LTVYAAWVFGLFGLIFIVYGVISLVKRDWMWTLTKMGNDFEGEASHRNEMWELRTVISGAVAIIIGVVLLMLPNGPVMPSFPGPPVPPFPDASFLGTPDPVP